MENFWNKWKERYYIVQYCILLLTVLFYYIVQYCILLLTVLFYYLFNLCLWYLWIVESQFSIVTVSYLIQCCCLKETINMFMNLYVISHETLLINWGRRGRDRMVVGFTTTYICNQCLSPLKLRVRIPFMARFTRYNILW